jgi:23S rRNA (uracil1939-C5)-methyltransferase
MENDTIPFSVERMDPLGQGVSKATDKITFIPRTLPGEKGQAVVQKSKGKSVQFAKLSSLEVSSPKRVEAECPHYNECVGCRYLHTDYENECQLKKEAYAFFYKSSFAPNEIEFHKAPKRSHYRNRIQLHYDKKSNRLGFMNGEEIVPTPLCLLPNEKVKAKMDELYADNHWHKLTKRQPETGHIEISESEFIVNQNYAFGGFTQVYKEMNDLASKRIHQHFEPASEGYVIDLFGGNGNLTRSIKAPTMVLDAIGSDEHMASHQSFFEFNVYNKWAMRRIDKLLQKPKFHGLSCEWLILDPPRSGLKTLDKFVQVFSPKKISYLSCDPLTQVRDLKLLEPLGWKIDKVEFFDFFPGTHHLESLVHVVKRN